MKRASRLIFALMFSTLAACGGGGSSGTPSPGNGDSTPGAGIPHVPVVPVVPGIPVTPPSTSTPDTTTPDNDVTPLPGEDSGVPDDSSTDNETPPRSITEQNFLALSWTIPSTREDGTYLPVYEIAGYELRYSKDAGTDVTVVRIDDAQTTEWILDNVTPGQYDFSIATIDTDGVYSNFSVETSAQVQ